MVLRINNFRFGYGK